MAFGGYPFVPAPPPPMLSSNIEDKYLCPICCEVLKSPVVIKQCVHRFCEVCVCRVMSVAEVGRERELLCPICRTHFVSSDLLRDNMVATEIAQATVSCTICHIVCPLSSWDQHSATHPLPQPRLPATPPTSQQPSTPCNRSTFTCPLCPTSNLTTLDLVTHVNANHAHIKAQKVCPVCASMPWGVANQRSQDIVHHLNYRHKFEYDTFVDYDCDEDATYKSVIAASMTDR